MIYLLVERLRAQMEQSHRDIGPLRVFTESQDPFRQVIAIVLSFFVCILFGPPVIRWLRNRKIGDLASFDQAQLDAMMKSKKGVPTMGGLLIIASILTSVLLLADLNNYYVRMGVLCVVLLGGLGAVDDWLKLTAGRRAGSRDGLTSREKLLFQVGLGLIFSYFIYQHGWLVPEMHTLYFPFFKNLQPELNLVWFMLIGTLVLTGTSNAVNLTDGLDGLAAGCMGIVSFTFFLVALIAGDQGLAHRLFIPHIVHAGEMALIAAAMTGACLGFLWFNCNPARVFMGDTGSLALGGLIGYLAIIIRQEFMLFLVGGIFVVEALSVMIQVGVFKYTRIKYGQGRRVFLQSPLHHHFQHKGWSEPQIVVRFWLIGAMLAALALATVKLR